MNILAIFFSVITLLVLRINGGVEGRHLNPIARKDIDRIEKQTRLQNNYTLETILTRHGDIYDCVNFYNQPSFDHTLVKNQAIFIPQNKPTLLPGKEGDKVLSVIHQNLRLDGTGCPNGTVPIRRANEDLIGEKLPIISLSRHNAKHYATCGAQEQTKYSGAQATIEIFAPEVDNQQYSAARMKLQIGPDSIEAGWRVDPALYRDNKSRFYIRTDAGNTHCFNTQCPGFVITDKNYPLDVVLRNTVPGGPHYAFTISIEKESTTGHWILRDGRTNIAIGYWPDSIFTHPGLADRVDWGGEVFGVDVRPAMGSGRKVSEDTNKDAFISNVQVMNGQSTQAVDPINVKCNADYFIYRCRQEGNVGGDLQFLIFYGGPSTAE